jgi:hypothetical protein
MVHITPNLCLASSGICGSHSAFRCIRGATGRRTTFHAQVGPVQILERAHRDTLRQTWVFASVGYASGVVSIKSASGQVTSNLCVCIRWDIRATYCILVRPGREKSTHNFSCSCGTSVQSTKSPSGHVTLNLGFASGGIYGSRCAFRCVWGTKY